MQHHRRTRRAMRLSRGLILGRLLTTLRHGVMGVSLLAMVSLTLTGHLGAAIVLACGLYGASKVLTRLTGEAP